MLRDYFHIVLTYEGKELLKRAEQSKVSYQGGLKAIDVCPSVRPSVNGVYERRKIAGSLLSVFMIRD